MNEFTNDRPQLKDIGVWAVTDKTEKGVVFTVTATDKSLDNSNGEIRTFQGSGPCANLTCKSKRNLITGECVNGDVTDDFCAFGKSSEIDPFTADITYGPLN